MKTAVRFEALARFLVEAHRRTYADKTAATTSSSRPRSVDYRFERDGLVYHDTYFGAPDYIGEEIIYRSGTSVWGMNYYGIILAKEVGTSEVYDFLREALKQDCIDIEPARGPRIYRQSRWSYSNALEGMLSDFSGTESIHRDDELVYRCRYHGCWIS